MSKKVEETAEGLLDFNWEDTGGAGFFEQEEQVETPTAEEQEEEQEEAQEEAEEQEEEQETSFFEAEEEEGSEEEEQEQPEGQGSSDDYVHNIYKDFKEKGLLKHYELEEGEELDFDKLFELQQADYEQEVSDRLVHWAKEELDEDAQAFIKFKRQGGNTEDFFKTYSSSSEMPIGGDITQESYQDRVIRYQLKEEGWDTDEIEDRLQYLTENGKKAQVAKRYDAKIVEKDKANKEALIQQAQAQREAAAQQEQTFRDTVKEALDETTEVNGFKITQTDKTELYNFLTKKNNKISDTRSITGFQKKLGEVFQEPSKMLLLAKLIHTDFDMSQFEKATKTKTTKKIKSNLEQHRNLRPNKSGSSSTGSSLADLF